MSTHDERDDLIAALRHENRALTEQVDYLVAELARARGERPEPDQHTAEGQWRARQRALLGEIVWDQDRERYVWSGLEPMVRIGETIAEANEARRP